MQTFQVEVSDNIADKIVWLLSSFEDDIKIKKISNNIENSADHISASVKKALDEVEISKKENSKLDDAWKLVDEL